MLIPAGLSKFAVAKKNEDVVGNIFNSCNMQYKATIRFTDINKYGIKQVEILLISTLCFNSKKRIIGNNIRHIKPINMV